MPKSKQRETAAQPSDQSEAKVSGSDLTEQPVPATAGEAEATEADPVAAGTAEMAVAAHRQRPMPPVPNPMMGLKMAAGIVRGFLPPRDRLIFYGGLGAATALGAVDLPVAVAIGAGVWVATHRRGNGQPRPVPPVARETAPAKPVPVATSGRGPA